MCHMTRFAERLHKSKKKKTLILVLCAWATYDCTVTNPEIHNDQQWLAGFLLGISMLMEQSYN